MKKSTLSPNERLDIYMAMLPVFELYYPFDGDNYTKLGYCSTFLFIKSELFLHGHYLESLLELNSLRPKDSGVFWFDYVNKWERDDNRCDLLYKSIEKVLPLCKL